MYTIRLKRRVRFDMEVNPRFWGMLSLAMKAGKLAVGESRATERIRAGEASLIVLSGDASENTKKKFSNMAAYRNIPLVYVADRETIGASIGRKFAVVVAVTDEGFSENFLILLNE